MERDSGMSLFVSWLDDRSARLGGIFANTADPVVARANLRIPAPLLN